MPISSEQTNPATIYLARLTRSSRRTMEWALRVIAGELAGEGANPESLPWAELHYHQVVQLRSNLAERYSPTTANRMLSALRGALREAWRLGQMDAEALARAIDVPAVRGRSAPHGRALAPSELQALFAACAGGSAIGMRDAAILAVLAAAGLRRAELAALDLADYVPATGALSVREGKGHKPRTVYAVPAAAYLQAWLAARGDQPGPLFLPMRRNGRLTWRRLTGDGLLKILRRRANQAGLRRFSPHDLRRTWVSSLLDAGADLAAVQGLAGHANPSTTIGYDRRGERARQSAALRLHLPDVPTASKQEA